MWRGTAAPAFKAAREREGDLNERQVEVLRLIERGHTNREIAELPGMSVDGAKWNVSEILTQLGLDSREEAAEYWRWRLGRIGEFAGRVRAVFGLTLVKWAGATGVAAASVVAGFLLLGRSSPVSRPQDVAPFYLKATETIVRTKERAFRSSDGGTRTPTTTVLSTSISNPGTPRTRQSPPPTERSSAQ